MAIYIQTNNPRGFLEKINELIESNKIRTWKPDKAGDFTHIADNWENKAWLKPYLLDKQINFGILKRKDEELERETYGVYHGRFIEMLINHLSDYFDLAKASTELDNDYDVPKKLV